MSRHRVNRTIAAPVERVFETVASIERFREAIPHITKVEFLTESRTGVGTRFRETRVVRGREATTELEVTEYVPNERVRLVSDAGGTVWDTVFTTRSNAAGTELTMTMDGRPHTLLARIVNPIMGRMIGKAVESDMDDVKAHCEAAEAS